MKLRKCYLLMTAAAIATTMASCSDDDNDFKIDPDSPSVSEGAYILNQGNFYSNIEGGLNVINYSGSSAGNVFKAANGRSIGDTPQCGVAYGSKIYVGTYESNTVEIINRSDYKSLKQIQLGADKTGFAGTQPRSMAAIDGKVYISMYDGYVCKLDTLTMKIEASVKVGPNPEQICIYRNRLYVPNSDGMNYPNYGKTATEIDLNNFTVSRTFEVGLNPNKFMSDENGLYVLCMGDYEKTAAKIYRVNTHDYSVTALADATLAATGDDEIFLINAPFSGGDITYSIYDTDHDRLQAWAIPEKPAYPSGIAVDEISDKVLVTSYVMNGQWPSYDAPGYVNVYDEDTLLFIRKFNIGSGPSCIFFNAL